MNWYATCQRQLAGHGLSNAMPVMMLQHGFNNVEAKYCKRDSDAHALLYEA